MELIADILLIAGATGAAAYCFVLARRLKRLTQLEGGMGSAIAVLSAQVDDLTRALSGAQKAAAESTAALEVQTRRAETALKQMELVMAAMHDLPRATPTVEASPAAPAAVRPAPPRSRKPEPQDEGPAEPARLPPWKVRPSGLSQAEAVPAAAPVGSVRRQDAPVWRSDDPASHDDPPPMRRPGAVAPVPEFPVEREASARHDSPALATGEGDSRRVRVVRRRSMREAAE